MPVFSIALLFSIGSFLVSIDYQKFEYFEVILRSGSIAINTFFLTIFTFASIYLIFKILEMGVRFIMWTANRATKQIKDERDRYKRESEKKDKIIAEYKKENERLIKASKNNNN